MSDAKKVSVSIGGDLALTLFLVFAVHTVIVTRGCDTTEEERRGYIEALPWTEGAEGADDGPG